MAAAALAAKEKAQAAALAAKEKAQATAMGIPRGRLVAQAALVVFVFGGSWVVVAGHIADFVGRCLAVEGPVLADSRCRHLMTYPPAVAVVSLLLMLALCIREAQAESKARKAGGGAQAYPYLPEVGFAVGPESGHLRGSDAMALAVMIAIYLCCFVVMIAGLVVRYAGCERELQHPGDKGAIELAETGSVIALTGCLGLWFEYCCLAIPYMMLRLRRFVRANWAASLSA